MSPARTEAQLEQKIVDLITDAPEGGISAADVRQLAADLVDTLFYRTSMPIYQAGVAAYDSATATISADIGGGAPQLPSFLAMVMPSVDRSGLAARLRIGGYERPLVDPIGNAVAPRQITPERVHWILRGANYYRIMDVLGVRPQDFAIRCALSQDQNLTAAQVAAGTSSDTSLVAIPDFGGENSAYVYVGSPEDAPRRVWIGLAEGGRNQIGGYQEVAGTIDDPNGVPYSWHRSSRKLVSGLAGLLFDVRFETPQPPP